MARHRLAAAAGAVAFVGAGHVLAPEPDRREAWTYLVALPLGYGHLIGAALAARDSRPGSRLRSGLVALVWLALFAAYTRALQSPLLTGLLAAPMLVVSAWHIVENDLALARVPRADLGLPALRWSPAELARVAAVTLLLAAAALTTPSGRQWSLLWLGWAAPALRGPTLADLAGAVLLYHALSFLAFVGARLRRIGRRRRRILLLSHALPCALNPLLYFWMDALHALVASPALYLFWSFAHALGTAVRRHSQRCRLPAGARTLPRVRADS